MFGTNIIGKRVMEVIKKRVAHLQVEYDEGCKEIDTRAEKEKTVLQDQLVDSVVSKFL